MKSPLWNNWQAKLMSVLIALVIWVYVKNQADPTFFDRVFTGTYSSEK